MSNVGEPMSDVGEPMRSYALDELMVQIIARHRTMDARLLAFLQVFHDEVTLPIEATLLGMPVEITEFDFFDDGRGLVARCLRPGADQYLTLADLVLEPQSVAAWIHAAYRQFLGMTPHSVMRPPDWELELDEEW
ncbi:MAG: hypothetical protein ACRDRZ_06615 [Pseudonocardiaceae bacterium]